MLEKSEKRTQYEQHKPKLEMEKEVIAKKYTELEAKYEQKRLALLVAEAKPMFDQGAVEAWLAEMRKELATMQTT